LDDYAPDRKPKEPANSVGPAKAARQFLLKSKQYLARPPHRGSENLSVISEKHKEMAFAAWGNYAAATPCVDSGT
jgi:hypothetical protein